MPLYLQVEEKSTGTCVVTPDLGRGGKTSTMRGQETDSRSRNGEATSKHGSNRRQNNHKEPKGKESAAEEDKALKSRQ